jgi:putative oxidoreductase
MDGLGTLLVETTPGLTDLALLIGRVFIGLCFVTHGLGKLGVVGTGSMSGFVQYLESLGVPLAPVQARMAMLSELAGGALLALGLFTRPACLLLVFTMLVAGRLGHKGAGYLITNEPPGAEYTINLAAICVVFALLGPGSLSLDHLLFASGPG